MTRLKPGQRVMNRYSGRRYIVEGLNLRNPVSEQWLSYDIFDLEAGHRYGSRLRNVLWVLCKNCDMPRKEHAKNKKCLYGPGYWEEP